MACSREFAGSSGTCPHDGNLLVPLPQDPYVGRRISEKYQVLSVLGTGGMGVVYLARHETMQCNVAIKMLRAQFAGDQISVKRFTQEAIAARRLTHPNVITTYDHGFTPQGQPYIVMDCLQGASLAEEIKKHKQISVERVLHIFDQACDALDHAHKQGVIHRDLKPGNLMLINYNGDPDFVKVVDFGVAKVLPINDENAQTLTQTGEVCGSPVYMSPEQCLGQGLDRRADIYSMGIVIYEALIGKVPLMGKSMVETMSKHINESPPPFKTVRPDLYIPERLEQVVMRALAKKPENRQQSMAMLRQELMMALPKPGQNQNLRSVATNVGLPPEVEEKPMPPWVVPAVSAAVASITFTAGVLFFMHPQAPQAPHAPNAAVAPAGTQPAQTTSSALPPVSVSPNAAIQRMQQANVTPVTPVKPVTTAKPAPVKTVQVEPSIVKPVRTPVLASVKPKPTRTAKAARPPAAKIADSSFKKPVKREDPFATLLKSRTYPTANSNP